MTDRICIREGELGREVGAGRGGLVGGVPCGQSAWVREKGSALRLLTQGVAGQVVR